MVGVVEHSGTMRGGHYVAYVRGGQRNREKVDNKENESSTWYHASDAYVRQVSLDEVLRCEAYILFYERNWGPSTFYAIYTWGRDTSLPNLEEWEIYIIAGEYKSNCYCIPFFQHVMRYWMYNAVSYNQMSIFPFLHYFRSNCQVQFSYCALFKFVGQDCPFWHSFNLIIKLVLDFQNGNVCVVVFLNYVSKVMFGLVKE